MTLKHFHLPDLSWRFVAVWRRNYLVWRKLAIPSLLGNLADPMIYMLGLGYGLGKLLPEVGGVSYVAYLAAGTVCYSTMNSASFEVLYSGFSRMHVQKTWDAILNAPVVLDDVIMAELLWAASKSLLAGVAILIVIWVLGLFSSPIGLWVVPLIFLIGLAFGSLGLVIVAIAPSFDFFLYYFTLFITPMVLLSGVFFPMDQLPPGFQLVASLLPLTHAVEMVRPLLLGRVPEALGLHLLILIGYGTAAFYLALVLFRRRLLK